MCDQKCEPSPSLRTGKARLGTKGPSMSPLSIGWLMSRVWPASIFSPDRPERVIRVHRGEATCIDQTKASAEGEQPEVVDCKVTDASSSASSATTIAAARAPQLLQPAAVEYNEVAEGDADEWHAAGLRKKHGRDSSSMRLSMRRCFPFSPGVFFANAPAS